MRLQGVVGGEVYSQIQSKESVDEFDEDTRILLNFFR